MGGFEVTATGTVVDGVICVTVEVAGSAPCVKLGGITTLFALGSSGTLSSECDFDKRSLSAFKAICLKYKQT